MGNKLSTPSAPIEYYLHDLVGYNPKETLSNSRFMKTVKCINKDEGYVAVKVYVIPDNNNNNANSDSGSEDPSITVAMAAAAAASISNSSSSSNSINSSGTLSTATADGTNEIRCHREYLTWIKDTVNQLAVSGCNVCAVQKVVESDKACFMVRQYFSCNLVERLSILPFLSSFDKRWITYQMLSGLAQLNSVGLCHGDIKPENVLLTTTNWAILTDIACCKPVMIPTASSVDFSFFFDPAGKRTCYIAPERFYDPGQQQQQQQGTRGLTHKMDVFSMGCTIASFYLEGTPLFNLSQLLEYRRGAWDKPPQTARIQDPDVRDLVEHMTQRDPEKRLTAEEYIRRWTPRLFPKWFEGLRLLGAGLLTKSPDQWIEVIGSRLEDFVAQIKEDNGHDDSNESNEGMTVKKNRKWVKDVDLNGFYTCEESLTDVFTATGSVFTKTVAGGDKQGKDNDRGSKKSKSFKSSLKNVSAVPFPDAVGFLEEEEDRTHEGTRLLSEIRDFIKNEVDPLETNTELGVAAEISESDSKPSLSSSTKDEEDDDEEEEEKQKNRKHGYNTINKESFIKYPSDPFGNERKTTETAGKSVKRVEDENNRECGVSLLAPYLAAAVRSCTMPSSQIKGLQLFVKISEYVSDKCKLQWCVPYIVVMLSKYEPAVRANAISALTRVLASVRDITGRDTKLFPEYITPALRQIEETDTEEIVLVSLANNLASLISTAQRFLEASHKRELELLKDEEIVEEEEKQEEEKEEQEQKQQQSKEKESKAGTGTTTSIKTGEEASTITATSVTTTTPLKKEQEKGSKPLSLSFDKEFSDFLDSFNSIIDGLITRRKQNSVRIAFLRNAGRICATLGQRFTSEKLLPLLISFMNERDWRLIEALLHNIVGVAAFIGQKSFEEFILPWTQQGFLTREDFVVEQGLSSMAELCRMGLLSRMSMVSQAQKWAPMLLHPNPWVRSSTVGLFAAISKALGPTDAYCFLLPALRPFLKHNVESLTQETILQALYPPIPLSIFGKVKDAIVALFKESNRAAVVSRVPATLSGLRLPEAELAKVRLVQNYLLDYCEHYSRQAQSLSSSAAMAPSQSPPLLTTATAGMTPGGSPSGSPQGAAVPTATGNTPSQEQQQKLQKAPNDLTYFASLKFPIHYNNINNYNNNNNNSAATATTTSSTQPDSSSIIISANSSTATSTSSTSIYDDSTLILAQSASAAFVSMGAGPLTMPYPSSTPPSKKASLAYPQQPGTASTVTLRKGDDGSWGRQSTDLGRVTQRPSQAAASAVTSPSLGGGSGGGPSLQTYRPAGILIGDFNEHRGAVTSVCTSRSGCFFASSSEDGTVKIWDCGVIRNKSKYTYNGNYGPVSALTVIEGTNTIACGYETGAIHLVRVDYDTTTPTRPKYRSTSCIQGIENLGGRVVCMDSWAAGTQFVLPYGLSSGTIAGLDIRSNENAFSFVCEPKFGQVETFAIGGNDRQWLVAGTSRGYYILWDLRFCVPAYFWRQPSKACIRKIAYRGGKTVVACAGADDITSWDVSTASITQINRIIPRGVDIPPIRSLSCINTDAPRDFAAEELEAITHETKTVISEISESLRPSVNQTATATAQRPRRVRTMSMFCAGNYIISGGDDMCIRYWDETATGSSYTICCNKGHDYSYTRSMIDGCTVQQAVELVSTEQMQNGKGTTSVNPRHKDAILDITATEFPYNMLITAGRDGKIKVWK